MENGSGVCKAFSSPYQNQKHNSRQSERMSVEDMPFSYG